MSENTQVDQSVDNPEGQATTEENVGNWTAQQLADRLKVVNAEAKDSRKKLQEEKRKREDLEKSKLAEAGKYEELANVWKRKAEEAESLSAKIKDAFAMKAISDSVALEAQKHGCVDPEALINLIDLKQLPLDESFNVDKSHVKVVIEDMRKQKPYFFKQAAPKVIDTTPGKVNTTPGKTLDKMTSQEIQQTLLEKFSKK